MPTILRDGPYSFVFFSSDRSEPPHIHVKRDRDIVKFWLLPIALASTHGLNAQSIRMIFTRRFCTHSDLINTSCTSSIATVANSSRSTAAKWSTRFLPDCVNEGHHA